MERRKKFKHSARKIVAAAEGCSDDALSTHIPKDKPHTTRERLRGLDAMWRDRKGSIRGFATSYEKLERQAT